VAEKEQLEEPKEEKKKGGLLKWIIIGVLLLGILGGGGFFGYKYFFMKKADTAQEEGGAAADAHGKDEKKDAHGGAKDEKKDAHGGDAKKDGHGGEGAKSTIVTLPPFVVNLADPMGRRYLKLTMDVELKDAGAVADFNGALPKVRDAVILLLSSKTFADLASMESKLQLKSDLADRLNQAVGEGKVLRVYFSELVVQ
jgi:flagellar protein FliL